MAQMLAMPFSPSRSAIQRTRAVDGSTVAHYFKEQKPGGRKREWPKTPPSSEVVKYGGCRCVKVVACPAWSLCSDLDTIGLSWESKLMHVKMCTPGALARRLTVPCEKDCLSRLLPVVGREVVTIVILTRQVLERWPASSNPEVIEGLEGE